MPATWFPLGTMNAIGGPVVLCLAALEGRSTLALPSAGCCTAYTVFRGCWASGISDQHNNKLPWAEICCRMSCACRVLLLFAIRHIGNFGRHMQVSINAELYLAGVQQHRQGLR